MPKMNKKGMRENIAFLSYYVRLLGLDMMPNESQLNEERRAEVSESNQRRD